MFVPGWEWIVGVCALLSLALVWAVLAPLRIRLSFEGRGDASGAWAAAGGVAVGPLSIAAVAARGVPGTMVVHIGGRKFLSRAIADLLPAPSAKTESLSPEELVARAKTALARFSRFLDPWETVLFLLAERRRLGLDFLDVHARFGGDDVALVGKITAGIYIVDTLLGPRVNISPEPLWQGEHLVALTAKGRIAVYPGRFILDTLQFLIRNFRVFRVRTPVSNAGSTLP